MPGIQRDIFAFGGLGSEPTLERMLAAIPGEVSQRLLLIDAPTTDFRGALKGKDSDERASMKDSVWLILRGGRIDRETLEPVLRANDVDFVNDDSPHGLVLDLIERLGQPRARELLDPHIRASSINTQGTFADFRCEDFDISRIKKEVFKATMEKELEERLAPSKKTRRLVRCEVDYFPAVKRLVVGLYLQRPSVDGRQLDGEKILRSKKYEREAENTYFILRRTQGYVIATLRSPTKKLAKDIRAALGVALWGRAGAVRPTPMTNYHLDVFRNINGKLPILSQYKDKIGSVLVGNVKLQVGSGNWMSIAAPGKMSDAIADLQSLSAGAPGLFSTGKVSQVSLRFIETSSKQRIECRASVIEDAITLDDQYHALIHDHLVSWGALRDG